MDDYRFCVEILLDILKKRRKELTNDSINLHPNIKTGLHKSDEYDDTVRSLYFQKYSVRWLDSHWKALQEKLDRDTEHSINEKRRIIAFFAKYFKNLFGKCMNTQIFSKELIPDLLKIEMAGIDEILKNADKADEKLESLSAEMVKHEDLFRQKLKELK